MRKSVRAIACTLVSLVAGVAHASEQVEHPHHLAFGVGLARHIGDNSEFWGIDYSYTFGNELYVLGFYEQVRGDFNVSAAGVQLGKHFGTGWKIAVGPGVETKLKSGKELLLFRSTIGYEWHHERVSFGPTITYDAIEDLSDVVYAGFSFGLGF
jgi:hypothetical protein